MDLAVIKFNEPVSGVMPYPIYTGGEEVGKEFTMMGWGLSGPVGTTEETAGDGTFLVGTNVFESANGTLDYTLDEEGIEGESIAWSGDSGGPAMIDVDGEWFIAGTNSGGDCCEFGNVD